MNVVFEADLAHLVAHRPGVLYWIIQPSGGVSNSVLRMVRPWDKWLATYGFDMDKRPETLTDEMCREIVGELIGDPTIPIEIESKSLWTINDMYALENTRGRVFCMGDAVHRHPPFNGLGSNTSIQDAYNLCWKLALVLKDKAAPSLLESYQTERVPVGRQIVKRAMKSGMELLPVYQILGAVPGRSEAEVNASIAARAEPTDEAAKQRATLREALDLTKYDFDAHGVEMNQRYASAAIVPDGSPDPGFTRDAELYYEPSSRPGAHVPHAWLADRQGHQISTLDLCGNGAFSLLTGIGGGGAWEEAAKAVEDAYGVIINVHVIGPRCAYDDTYGDWAAQREVSEAGAVLVRPDQFVAWRAQDISASAANDLVEAMGRILGRQAG